MTERLSIRVKGGRSNILWIDLKGHNRSSLDLQTFREFHHALDKYPTHGVVIASRGEAFCAGLDLIEIIKNETAKAHLEALVALYTRLLDHRGPTAALVESSAWGGGVGLAICTDIIIASCRAHFSLPSDPVYRPLANLLLPFAEAKLPDFNLARFEKWFGHGLMASEMLGSGYIHRVIHKNRAKGTRSAQSDTAADRFTTYEQSLLRMVQKEWDRKKAYPRSARSVLATASQSGVIDECVVQAVAASKRRAFQFSAEATINRTARDPRAVFVVHGRNLRVRDVVIRLLKDVGLTHLSFDTIRRALKTSTAPVWDLVYTGVALAQAVVVILTAEDSAALVHEFREPHDRTVIQPRPNVLIEAGLALGMCPHRVITLQCGDPHMASDIAGFLAINLDRNDGWRDDLKSALRIAGCPVGETSGSGRLPRG